MSIFLPQLVWFSSFEIQVSDDLEGFKSTLFPQDVLHVMTHVDSHDLGNSIEHC